MHVQPFLDVNHCLPSSLRIFIANRLDDLGNRRRKREVVQCEKRTGQTEIPHPTALLVEPQREDTTSYAGNRDRKDHGQSWRQKSVPPQAHDFGSRARIFLRGLLEAVEDRGFHRGVEYSEGGGDERNEEGQARSQPQQRGCGRHIGRGLDSAQGHQYFQVNKPSNNQDERQVRNLPWCGGGESACVYVEAL
jgi:hypothetical protein